MNIDVWNPWHGCKKYSEGCAHCYVYRRDDSIGKDASEVKKTSSFDLAIKKNRRGEYKISPGSDIFVCMTSDFFLEEADEWRKDIWDMIRARKDVDFTVITKRILRFEECVPDDWENGWDNVTFGCTIENQKRCDERLEYFLNLPIKNKFIICEPLLGKIDFGRKLDRRIKNIVVGGESGNGARMCDYEWVLDIRRQCEDANVGFSFKQTGADFFMYGKRYRIPRKFQHSQAKKANIDIDV